MNVTPAGQAWLELDEKRVPLGSGLTLGRSRGSDLVLADDRVSRHHAAIHAQNYYEHWLVDFGSSNGTYLNGRRVLRPMVLRDRDLIGIDPFRLIFRTPWQHDAEFAEDQTTVLVSKPFDAWLMLADIVGSTRLMQDRPADEVAVLIGGWIARSREILEQAGGFIDKYLGDGFLAFCDVQRSSVSDVVSSLRAFKALQGSERPSFRIIVHRGSVARGSPAAPPDSERTFGRDVHFIFRLEHTAKAMKKPCLMSAAAAANLGRALGAASLGKHPVADFERQELFSF